MAPAADRRQVGCRRPDTFAGSGRQCLGSIEFPNAQCREQARLEINAGPF